MITQISILQAFINLNRTNNAWFQRSTPHLQPNPPCDPQINLCVNFNGKSQRITELLSYSTGDKEDLFGVVKGQTPH